MQTDLAQHMRAVAKATLGDPNPQLSSGGKLRFNGRGSLAVDLVKGTFFDHEAGEGGGVLALIERTKGLKGKDAIAYIREIGCDVGDDAREIVATYDYVDETGTLIFQVVRFDPKDFRQRKPDGAGGWTWSTSGVRQVPYRLPDLNEALAHDRTVFIVEGEKDVDRLWAWNVPATCNAGGAGKWRAELSEFLRNADVVILPDNDPQAKNPDGTPRFHPDGRPVYPGQDHARDIAAKLAGVANRVRILELPNLPLKGDVSDWVRAGGTAEELWRLAELALPAEQYQPSPSTTPKPVIGSWWRDPATIPPREFLYGRHYIRRAIGATIAAGGRGKTTLSVYEAVTMTAGRNLVTGVPLPDGPLRAWVLNGEEDQDELDRRVAAVCQRYRVTQADLGGRLFVQSVSDHPMRIATIGNGQPIISAAVQKHMVEFVGDNRIDVFMVDPLISFHGVVENDNSHMDLVVKQGFGVIANKTASAGELFHHPGKPKPGQVDTTVEDGRGASAVLWAVRGARVLNFMTPAEAEKLGMSDDERKLHVRIANGKANMAPLGKAEWMKIEVENLPNGDQVACSSPWQPPNPFDDITFADMELAQRLARTGAYRDDVRSPEWFGYALAPHLNLAVSYKGANEPKDLAKLKSIIKTWKDNKALDVVRREDESRRERDFIVPGSAARSTSTSRYSDDEEVALQ
jgi:hypothetical protein